MLFSLLIQLHNLPFQKRFQKRKMRNFNVFSEYLDHSGMNPQWKDCVLNCEYKTKLNQKEDNVDIWHKLTL